MTDKPTVTNDSAFQFNHARHLAALDLRPQHVPDFQRLVKDLRFGSRFQLLICEYSNATYRDALIERLDAVLTGEGLAPAQLRLTPETHPDFAAAEADLRQLAAQHPAIHVLGGESWFDDTRWQTFNVRREAVARDVPARLLLWLRSEPLGRLARLAPDLWAWRAGVFSFTVEDAPVPTDITPQRGPIDTRSLAERSQRIATLRAYLDSEPPPPDDIRLPLLDEMAELYRSLGKLEESLRIREQEELPAFEKLGDLRSAAVTRGQIADILVARGELDTALRIHEQEVLPVFEKLGNLREAAVTRSKIADILRVRGELDTALRILEQEVLPVFEKLGDVHSATVARGKIANILQARGELDAALRIREQEVLPVYEKLGDLRSAAVARSKIADILQSRGELAAALRLHEQEVLPVLEKLGDRISADKIKERISTLKALLAAPPQG
ncbi:MAG: hypothetical protein KGZ83_21595 [Sulfuricella sp.]|nr:hypothetical protein [Sulfuricella sp.]